MTESAETFEQHKLFPEPIYPMINYLLVDMFMYSFVVIIHSDYDFELRYTPEGEDCEKYWFALKAEVRPQGRSMGGMVSVNKNFTYLGSEVSVGIEFHDKTLTIPHHQVYPTFCKAAPDSTKDLLNQASKDFIKAVEDTTNKAHYNHTFYMLAKLAATGTPAEFDHYYKGLWPGARTLARDIKKLLKPHAGPGE